MASVKAPLHSTQASGKADGLIYARNQYGAYTRDYVVPTQPDSAPQLAWRAAMTACNTAWNNPAFIDATHLGLWQQFAENFRSTNRFGKTIKLGAKEWFIKFNIWRSAKGLSLVDSPPKNPLPNYYPEITIYWDTGGIYAEVFPRPVDTQFVHFRGNGPWNATRNFAPNTMSFLGNYDVATTSPLLLIGSGSIDTNPHHWFFRVRVIDIGGQSSNPLYFTVKTSGTAPQAIWPIDHSNALLENLPDSVFADQQGFRLFLNPGTTRTNPMEVDLTGIGYNTVLKSFLYLRSQTGFTGNVSDSFHEQIQAYVPAQVTWNSYSTGNAWSEPGGEAGVDFVEVPVYTLNDFINEQVWYRFDITSWMNGEISGGGANSQFWLRPNINSPSPLFYGVGEATASLRPFILNQVFVA